MNKEFSEIISKFSILMEELNNSSFIRKDELGNLPKQGIYVFYNEKGIALYVGRSKRLGARLKEHGQPSSGHTSATFAFNNAKRIAKERGLNIDRRRRDLESDLAFSKLYQQEKDRVSKMQIKVIGIEDPIVRTLFEVYVHLELKTDNKWIEH